jgi:hypothetical protein
VSARPGLARAGALLVLGAIAAGAALLGAAMRLYPGGNATDHGRSGHSFWLNYLCDLTPDVAVNGASTARGAALARAGMLVLTAALGLVWLLLPRVLGGGRWSAAVVRVGGVLCALGMFAVPFVEGALHPPIILLTVVPGVAALATALVGLWRGRRTALLTLAVVTLAFTVADALLYAARVGGWVAASSPAVPLLQRVAALLLLAWMAGVGVAVLREPTARPR